MMPPPRRAGKSALVLVLAAWVLLLLVIVFRNELGDDFARPEAWRSALRRVMLGLSALLALFSTIPAVNGFKRAPILCGLSLFLAVGWCGLMAWRLFG